MLCNGTLYGANLPEETAVQTRQICKGCLAAAQAAGLLKEAQHAKAI